MVVVIKKGSSKETIKRLIKKLNKSNGFDAKKHSGVIKLHESPLDIQKRLRNDWQ